MSGVRDGIVSVGYHAGTYTPAELPISNALQELGFNYKDPLVMMLAASDFNMTNAAAIKQWSDAGVVYGGGYSTPPYNLMCSKPIKSLATVRFSFDEVKSEEMGVPVSDPPNLGSRIKVRLWKRPEATGSRR